jgi:hypothetical protein
MKMSSGMYIQVGMVNKFDTFTNKCTIDFVPCSRIYEVSHNSETAGELSYFLSNMKNCKMGEDVANHVFPM